MSAVSIELIKQLRETSGAGMMDCKKALAEANGDMEAATEFLRKKGLAAANKKAGRTAAEGLIAVKVEGPKATMLELNSETDFVAKNDNFTKFANKLVELAFNFDGNVEDFKKSSYDSAKTVDEAIAEHISIIGENIKLNRIQKLEVENGFIASYIHNAVTPTLGKIGALVAFETDAKAEDLQTLGRQIAMHVAAASPESLNVEGLSPQLIEKEKKFLEEQALASGKPKEVVDKMLEGRMRKFYQEVVLLEQLFVVDGKTKISQLLEDTSKQLGKEIKIKDYSRYSIGETVDDA